MTPSPSDLTTSALREALRAALPSADVARVQDLAEALVAAARNELSPTAAQATLREHGELLRELTGRTVTGGGVHLSFDNTQLGDVRIGTIAGRDLITISLAQTIITAEQAYQVAGLPNPYRGLQPFTYADRDSFGGRERIITAALARLTTPGEERVLLFVTGSSGSGKSSFVQAGLLPALEQHYADRGLTLRHVVMRPSRQPLAALADALRQLGIPPDGPFAAAASFTLVAPIGPRPDVAVLIVDQFEELFTQSEPAQRDALLALLAAVPPFRDLRAHIICTLRSDFLGELAEHRGLEPAFREQILLRAMHEDELRVAIQRPIQQAHPEKRIEPALLKQLAQDAAGEAGYLPLLQVTLEDLWRRGSLTLGAYGSLTDAIRDRAEQIYTYQDYDGARQHLRGEAEQAWLMGLLLDLVEVSLNDASRRDVRRRRRMAELTRGEAERARLVGDLVTARLLSTSVELRDGAEVEVIDIIHESLITNWDRLRAAIAAQREALQRRAHFEAALREWLSRSKPDDYLLDGGRLAEAQLLGETEDIALNSEQAREFLRRSITRREEQRRRQLRRTQIFAGVLGVLLLAAVTAAGWAVTQTSVARQEADQRATAQVQAQEAAAQARTAEARTQAELNLSTAQRLAFAAQTLPIEPALQLAYEAYARDQSSSIAEFVLHELVKKQAWHVIGLSAHSDSVNSAVFSPDGSRILTASKDGTARLWDASGQPLATLEGHSDSVNSAVFSPDGSRILTASEDGTARLWDASGSPLATLEGHTGPIWSAVFSPDGSRILTASDDGTARLWDASGSSLATLEGHTGPVRSAVFAADGSRILTASDDGTARLWDTSGSPLATLEGHTHWVYSAVYSPDGGRILTASYDGTAQLWDASGSPLATLEGHSDWVYSAVYSPDGGRILTASADGTAQLWDASGSSLATLEGHTGPVRSAVYSPDGNRILTASYDGTARLWDASGTPLATLEGHSDWINSVVFAADGSRILTASYDGTARLWEASSTPLATLEGHIGPIWSAVYSPDGSRILTASDDGTARLWDASGLPITTLESHTGLVGSAVYSPDGNRILTASRNGAAQLWDASGSPLATLEGHTDWVSSAVFSPDGSRILTASRDHTARLWDISGSPLAVLEGHSDRVTSAMFSPDGGRILTTSWDHTARLWDASGNPLAILESHTSPIWSAVFSPDGSRILTALDDGTARLWDASGTPLATLEGHSDWINSAVFSPDGSHILTASQDGSVRLWEASGNPLATLEGHTSSVTSAVFSPDGSRILTASGDGTARQYFVNPEELLAAAACRIARPLTDVEIARYNVPQPLKLNLAARHCSTPTSGLAGS